MKMNRPLKKITSALLLVALFASWSAVLHRAIDLLRASQLEHAYAAAFEERSEDEDAWDVTVGDGLGA